MRSRMRSAGRKGGCCYNSRRRQPEQVLQRSSLPVRQALPLTRTVTMTSLNGIGCLRHYETTNNVMGCQPSLFDIMFDQWSLCADYS